MKKYLVKKKLSDFSLWEKLENTRKLLSLTIEVTARCNNFCRHCYINLPPNDKEAKSKELRLDEISTYADQAVSLGALWCLLSGGEPLLRKDFEEIYLNLIHKGLLVSVFTNANLITQDHVELFKKHPPRDVEVSVYGVTQGIYEKVTRVPGSFDSFKKGLGLLIENGIKVRLKAVALRSNILEFEKISEFCRNATKDYFRFDPFLHLRYDKNIDKNKKILSERLTPSEIITLEESDSERFQSLKKVCNAWGRTTDHTFQELDIIGCGAGLESCAISCQGLYHLCSSLVNPDFTYNLREGSLTDAWLHFTPKVRSIKRVIYPDHHTCTNCSLNNFCMACPAINYLESGNADIPIDHFCTLAKKRALMLEADLKF